LFSFVAGLGIQTTVRELLQGYLLAKHTVSSNLCSSFLASWISPLTKATASKLTNNGATTSYDG